MSGRSRVHLAEAVVGREGATTVFCHGLFGRGKNFTTVAKALVPDLRSVLLDMPDHGESDWTEEFDYARAADAVADHLRARWCDDGPVHVVGHSMGGKIAMTLALRHPELVDRLVVVDITPTGSADGSNFAHLLDSLARIDLDELTSHGDADRALARDVDQPYLRGFLLQNLRRDRGGEGFAWQPNLDLLRRDLPKVMGDIPTDGAPFDGPVLWMAGERSPYVRPGATPVMKELFPRVMQVTIKGAGHWVHSEKPEAFTSAVRTFLATS